MSDIITMKINYTKVIIDNNLYFLKKIGKGMFIVNLINGNLGIIEIKCGKILKEFDVDEKICFYINILDIDDEGEKNKLNKNILILNQNNIYILEI